MLEVPSTHQSSEVFSLLQMSPLSSSFLFRIFIDGMNRVKTSLRLLLLARHDRGKKAVTPTHEHFLETSTKVQHQQVLLLLWNEACITNLKFSLDFEQNYLNLSANMQSSLKLMHKRFRRNTLVIRKSLLDLNSRSDNSDTFSFNERTILLSS